MRFLRKRMALITFSALLLLGYQETCNANGMEQKGEIRNIIFLIGDGMGVSFTSGYRYFKDNPDTLELESTEFGPYLVGQQTTFPNDPNYNVTDSAASATAMATGVKTYNGAIGIGNDHSKLKSVLEAAKEKGKAAGLVATAQITHGTPAAFGAHVVQRKSMSAIADDYYQDLVNGHHKIDVLLGGGSEWFIRSDRNLVEDFVKDGYSYVRNLEELQNDHSPQVLGLFARRGLPKMIDRPKGVPSLAEMAGSAIERLSKNDNGFFLMIEGSQIDWAGHDNDIVGVMSEMEDFEEAFKAAIDFAKKDGHTLVIATADHSTGGYTIGAQGQYNWFSSVIKAVKRTPDYIAAKIVNGADVKEALTKYIEFPLTRNEINSVQRAARTHKARNIDNAIEEIINTRSFTGWTTKGHTGEDVNVYAYGPGSERFRGQIDNTDHAKIIFDILK
ncbi:alkaline phosphatase [Neobacillus niacini]|jgi:alkaline phosphatase|uniref:alkaline phosphatase n=1 Tax=Neobacillus niacini TaxID=86668 RepID=UPI001C8E1853|nr:alkaline phosphatase [Neobacillus niacini]MBY0147596.1 alkaline phosphatase [Neobacillus niacini]